MINKEAIRNLLVELDSLDERINSVQEFLERLEKAGAGQTTFRTAEKSAYATFDLRLPSDEIQKYVRGRLTELATQRDEAASKLQEISRS